MNDETCKTCRFFSSITMCRRYPEHVVVTEEHWCGEWDSVPPSPAILGTDIALLSTSPHTRNVCKRLCLQTVQDLIDVGRAHITTNGRLDRVAINELALAMQNLGVRW